MERIKQLIQFSKNRNLYHYSKEPRTLLLTNHQRGVKTKWGDLKTDYDHHLSFFMEPIPENISTLLGGDFKRWVKGDVLYEHIVKLSDVDIYKYSISSTEESFNFYLENFNERLRDTPGYIDEYLLLKKEFLLKEELIGTNVDTLIAKIPNYISKDKMRNYIKQNKEHGNKEQYASNIPHLMLYVNTPVKVTRVNKITIR